MQPENIKAEALRGYKFFPHPDSSTLGILRMDTENEQHWVLVDRKILLLLSDALAKHAQELDALQ